jgi:hypothetical protein
MDETDKSSGNSENTFRSKLSKLKLPWTRSANKSLGELVSVKADQIIPEPSQTVVEDPPLPTHIITPSTKTREQRMTEHAKWRSQQQQQQQQQGEEKQNTESSSVDKEIAQDKKAKLPSGFKEVRQAKEKIKLLIEQFPWLEEDLDINLVDITLAGSDNKHFLFGSAIKANITLLEAADQLDERRKRVVDNMLYTQLPTFIDQGHTPSIRQISNPRSETTVYVTGNTSGQRVYFTRLDKIDDKPVIVRLAICDKSKEEEVLGQLTSDSKKVIKASARL